MARFSKRVRIGIRNYLNVCDWCVKLASPTPPYIDMGGQGFHHLGGCCGRQALIIRSGLQLPLGHVGHRLTFIFTNHNSQHFILGMGRASRKLPNSVILSHHHTNMTLSQEKYDIPNHPKHHQWHTFPYAIRYIIWLYAQYNRPGWYGEDG